MLGAEVGQLVVFEVAPDVFGGVEFWRVGRKAVDVESPGVALDERGDLAASVDGRPVPDDQEFAADVAQQQAEEFDHLRAFDRAVVEPEVEV